MERIKQVADTADHIRIRVGTEDGNTSLSVAEVLALALEDKTDSDVDYALVWGNSHMEMLIMRESRSPGSTVSVNKVLSGLFDEVL